MIHSRLVSHHLTDASHTEASFSAPALCTRVCRSGESCGTALQIHRPGREEGDGTVHCRTETAARLSTRYFQARKRGVKSHSRVTILRLVI